MMTLKLFIFIMSILASQSISLAFAEVDWIQNHDFGSEDDRVFTKRLMSVHEHKIEVLVNHQGMNSLKIYITPEKDQSKPPYSENSCLIYGIFLESKTGYVESLKKLPECKAQMSSMEVTGNHLLTIVDFLADEFKLKSNELIDGSSVSCEDAKDQISLKWLHLFSKSSTWYESKGYRPIFHTEKEYQEYRIQIEVLRKYSLRDIYNDLLNHQKIKEFSDLEPQEKLNWIMQNTGKTIEGQALFEFYASTYLDLNPQAHLADFMYWISQNHCAQFDSIVNGLLKFYVPQFRQSKWSSILNWINEKTSYMMKRYS